MAHLGAPPVGPLKSSLRFTCHGCQRGLCRSLLNHQPGKEPGRHLLTRMGKWLEKESRIWSGDFRIVKQRHTSVVMQQREEKESETI